MAQVKLDKPVEKGPTVDDLKRALADLQSRTRSFMNTYKLMKPKERADHLQSLTKGFTTLNKNVERFRSLPMNNAGVKFGFETFRQSYASFLPRWRKFESELLGLPE